MISIWQVSVRILDRVSEVEEHYPMCLNCFDSIPKRKLAFVENNKIRRMYSGWEVRRELILYPGGDHLKRLARPDEGVQTRHFNPAWCGTLAEINQCINVCCIVDGWLDSPWVNQLTRPDTRQQSSIQSSTPTRQETKLRRQFTP